MQNDSLNGHLFGEKSGRSTKSITILDDYLDTRSKAVQTPTNTWKTASIHCSTTQSHFSRSPRTQPPATYTSMCQRRPPRTDRPCSRPCLFNPLGSLQPRHCCALQRDLPRSTMGRLLPTSPRAGLGWAGLPRGGAKGRTGH